MKFDILNRLTDNVQITAEIECDEGASQSLKVGLAIKWAIKNNADLHGANLHGADLCRAYLYGADLCGADLCGASLYGAYLNRADLNGAYLCGADLCGANLCGADLCGADLYGAYLNRANLCRAYLNGAYLTGAYLTGADLNGAYLNGAYLNGGKIKDAITLGYANEWAAITYLTENGEQRVKVGCRDKTIAEGRAYWANKNDRREVMAILDYAEALGRIRGWGS